MKTPTHIARIVLLMAGAAGLCGWIAANATIMSTDGLRYIHQAQELEGGKTFQALFRSIDHPAYPLAISAVHRLIGGDGPVDWQRAAQVASVIAGALLVIPLYLVALEMFGASSAWLAVVLSFLVPVTGHVMGDAMSESLFLLFLFSGVWTSIRFLKEGRFSWLPPTILFAALAFWVRPDALVLPAALVATLGVIPLMRSTRLLWPRWWKAVAFLVIGPACLIAPILASKGSLATKPAVMRVLGLGPRSAALAVERKVPLDPNQSTAKTYVLAARAMAMAVRDSVTIPLLPLALLGLILSWPPGERGRPWVFLSILMVAWGLALIRLHATGGYCTPRHAMILAYPLIASAAFGFERLITSIAIPGRWLGQVDGRYRLGPIAWIAVLAALVVAYKPEIEAPINNQFVGYRYAGGYIEENVPPDEKVVDLTGWSLFYGKRTGYTFANLIEAMGDRSVTRVVVRDAHLQGKWEYCKQLQQLIGDRKPVVTFPLQPEGKQSLVYIFDWSKEPGRTVQGPSGERR
jgi:4-amino-4-deoxy-L-arabinose transferase-like glycosyltransferase